MALEESVVNIAFSTFSSERPSTGAPVAGLTMIENSVGYCGNTDQLQIRCGLGCLRRT